MDEQEPGKPVKDPKSWSDYSKYTAIVFQMALIIGIFAYAGYRLDGHYKHETPWVTALFCVAGVCLSIYQVIRSLKSA